MKTNRTKVIQLLLGFALTLGLMLGLSGPAMAQDPQTDPQTTPTYQEVKTWQELKSAIDSSSTANIRLTADCTCPEDLVDTEKVLSIGAGKNVVLDLNGQTLKRELTAAKVHGNVIRVVYGGQLTLEDSSSDHSGKITGGYATNNSDNGSGGVFVGSIDRNKPTSKFIMNGGTIEGNRSTDYGGGVFVGYDGSFEMNGGTIQDNSAATAGGGVYLHDSSSEFTMTGGMIGSEESTNGDQASKGNQASNGGGVYISSDSAFTMNGGSISNNSATSGDYGGGGVYSNGPFIMKNKAVIQNNHASHGGGVYLKGNSFTMTDSRISGNQATSGGGVYLMGTHFTMTDSTISGNEATSSGGGVCAENNSTFNMNSGAIQGNTATDGGGVYFNGGTFNMSGGTIGNEEANKGNHAANGGGVYNGGGSFTMGSATESSPAISCTISGNTATQNGGGVYNTNAFTMQDGAVIDKNTATANGGGVYNTGTFVMNAGTIGNEEANKGNHAANGGGVYNGGGSFTMGSATESNSAISCIISGNTADIPDNGDSNTDNEDDNTDNADNVGNGGGVYVAKSGTFTLSKGLVQNNTAGNAEYEGDGGGVHVNGGTFTMTGGNLQHNIATQHGGGVFIAESSRLALTNGAINGNNATANGGGIYSCVDFSIGSDARIQSNNATNGGGVYVNKGAFTVSGSTIDYNTATNGGGVYVNTGGTFNMSGGEINGNTATDNGGGVYIVEKVTQGETTYNSTFNMTGGTIQSNNATNGGGVCNTGSTFNMTAGTIDGNTATENGGGVYNTGTFAMTAGTIGNEIAKKGNHAANGGGVYNGGGSFTMDSATESSSCTISGNTATQNGGGVYNTNAFTMQDGAVIDKNTATANGGGVYNTGTFAMNAGTIGNEEANKGNHAANGGGVYNSDGSFTMGSATGSSPCTISGNTADIPDNGDSNTDNEANNTDNTENVGNGGGVFITENSTFTLYKGTIKSNTATANGGGIYSNINLKIGKDAVIQSNTAENGGGVYVNKGAFTVSGSTIQYNNATNGGGVYAAKSGAFTLDSTTGAIQYNEATNGGGVYIAESGTFSLNKGTISGNTAANGGGIYSCVDFSIGSDARIQSNNATNGGGVYVNGGTLTMTGGTMQSNNATNGGGVYIAEKVTQGETTYNSTFNMTGGTIQSNNATNGGGVYVNGGSFTMTGGYLENNSSTQNGGGIYAATNIKLDGKPAITGNTVNNEANNVYLAKDVKIDVGKNLQPAQRIGVTIPKKLGIEFAVITTNANYATDQDAQDDFIADDDKDYNVYKTLRNNQARLRPRKAYDVILVGGNHATPNGPTEQENVTNSMQPVTYTANYGYQFPQSSPYYKTTDGITVQRTGQSTVTVSGQPTADVTVTVPDAVEKSRVSHTVTFKVENGAWDDGTTEDKTVTLSGYVDETLRLKQDQIPAVGGKPDNYYKAGSWDTEPSPDTPITEDMTYTYTYEKQAVVMPTLYFAAHVQNYGWDKKNQVLEPGKTADVGTTGQSLRVEDLAVIVPKDLKVDGYAHVQNVGDMAVKKVESTKDYTIPEGYVAYEFGTTGKSQRVEAVCISIKDPDGQYITGFQYAVHLQNYGWQGYVRNGSFAGTRGMSLRVEALRFVFAMPDVVPPGEPK